MKTLLLFICMHCSFGLFAQNYSYSFEGKPINTTDFEEKLLRLTGVVSVKVQLKEFTNIGEILFEFKQPEVENEGTENLDPFIQIKQQLLNEGLTPKELVELHY